MRRYYTLWGQRFDLESLSPDECSTIDQILEVDRAAHSDDDSLASARRVIRENYPTFAASGRVLSGAVGAIYRDLWYRRQIKRAEAENRADEVARILKNIRAHPARIIHDAFLDIGISQAEFARRFGLSRSVLSKLTQCFKPRKEDAEPSEPVFATSTIIETVARLAIGTHGVYFDQPSPRSEEPKEIAAPPTLRERLLLRTIISGVRELRGEKPADAAQSLARELAHIFNDVNIHFLDALVKTVVAAARNVADFDDFRIEALITTDCSERLFPKDTHRSKCLLSKWMETEWAGRKVVDVLDRSTQQAGGDPESRDEGSGKSEASPGWAKSGEQARERVKGRHGTSDEELNSLRPKVPYSMKTSTTLQVYAEL